MWEWRKIKELRAKLDLRTEEVKQHQRIAKRWERKYTALRERIREAMREPLHEQMDDVAEMVSVAQEALKGIHRDEAQAMKPKAPENSTQREGET